MTVHSHDMSPSEIPGTKLRVPSLEYLEYSVLVISYYKEETSSYSRAQTAIWDLVLLEILQQSIPNHNPVMLY